VAGGPEGYGGHVTFYIEVPDVEAALAKAEELGGSRIMGPDDVMPGLVIGQFADPEGHMVGVVSGSAQ
jgi:predicted enzyme related to lactoylglutathione lyase